VVPDPAGEDPVAHRLLLLVLAVSVGSCLPYGGHGPGDGPDSSDADTDADTDSDADVDADTDTDSDTDAPQLDSGHTGWREAACFDCHDQGGHRAGLDPWQCVSCHGRNGAPDGHHGATPCGDCHGQPHGSTGFPDPESCEACHVPSR
jgi:hypothetical protein